MTHYMVENIFRFGPEKLYRLHFQDVTQNSNWNNCLDTNGQSLARCIYNCNDDAACEADCVDQFKTKTEDCPCEVCPIPRIKKSPAAFGVSH